MNKLSEIAFRNIFRNFRRSILTIIICFLAVTGLTVSSSFLGGMIGNILDESIKFSGHVRLNSLDYDLQERLMSLTGNVSGYNQLKQKIAGLPGVHQVVGRLKFAGLVYKDDQNKEALGYGIEAADLDILNLRKSTYQGRAIDPKTKDEIVIGYQLAQNLKLKIGDQVTILTKTLYNSMWASNFRVVGIFDLQNGRLNKGFYLSLAGVQELLDMSDQVLEVAVFGNSRMATADLVKTLEQTPSIRGLQIKRWDQIGFGPTFTSIVTIVSTIIQFIVISLAGLGIANTMMMAVFERKNEIGLLKSMGMHEIEITTLFTLEGFFLGLIGTFLGLLVGGTLAYLLHTIGLTIGVKLQTLPISVGNTIYGSFDSFIFAKATILGLGAALLASFLPAVSGVRLKPIDALRKE